MGRFASLVLVAALLAPSAASAEVFKLYGEVLGGGKYGKGVAGTYKDEAFFGGGAGAYGATLGARVLVFDARVAHHQFYDGELSTWTQFMLGLNFGMDTGSEWDRKQGTGGYFEVGTGLGFGVGTGAQVDPPLDNAQVTDKGFVLEGRIGFGTHLSKVFDFGVVVPVSYGFFFKSGAGANETENQYQSVQVEALLVLRANIRLI